VKERALPPMDSLRTFGAPSSFNPILGLQPRRTSYRASRLSLPLRLRLFRTHPITLQRIPGVLPVGYPTRVMPNILKAMLDKLLINKNTGRATRVRTVDDDLLRGIERFPSIFLEMDRARNTFDTKCPIVQTIDQSEVLFPIELRL